jgi:Na+/H+ antiporter NhaD/arsenite permease-like protein
VVILGLAERNGRPVVFWQFTRYGPIATVITIAVCVPYPWQRYFPLA